MSFGKKRFIIGYITGIFKLSKGIQTKRLDPHILYITTYWCCGRKPS